MLRTFFITRTMCIIVALSSSSLAFWMALGVMVLMVEPAAAWVLPHHAAGVTPSAFWAPPSSSSSLHPQGNKRLFQGKQAISIVCHQAASVAEADSSSASSKESAASNINQNKNKRRNKATKKSDDFLVRIQNQTRKRMGREPVQKKRTTTKSSGSARAPSHKLPQQPETSSFTMMTSQPQQQQPARTTTTSMSAVARGEEELKELNAQNYQKWVDLLISEKEQDTSASAADETKSEPDVKEENSAETLGVVALARQESWTAYLDVQGTGLIYYFNHDTGASQWTAPTETFPEVSPQFKRDILAAVAAAQQEERFQKWSQEQQEQQQQEAANGTSRPSLPRLIASFLGGRGGGGRTPAQQ